MFPVYNDSSERFVSEVDELEWTEVYATYCNQAAETVASSSHVITPSRTTTRTHRSSLHPSMVKPCTATKPTSPSPSRQFDYPRYERRRANASEPQWVRSQPPQDRFQPSSLGSSSPLGDDNMHWKPSTLPPRSNLMTSRQTASVRRGGGPGHDRSCSILSTATTESASSSGSTPSSMSSVFPATPSDSSASLFLAPPPAFHGKGASKSILTRSSSKHSTSSTVKSVTFAEAPTFVHEPSHEWDMTPSTHCIHECEDDDDDYIMGDDDTSPHSRNHHPSSSHSHSAHPGPVPLIIRTTSTSSSTQQPQRRSLKRLFSGQRPASEAVSRPEISRPLALGSMLPPSSSAASCRSVRSTTSVAARRRQERSLRGQPSTDSFKSVESGRSTASRFVGSGAGSGWGAAGVDELKAGLSGWLGKLGFVRARGRH